MAWLGALYPWAKAIHVMAIITWMAGIFYLPRLFVYHAERGSGAEPAASFRIMEDKLYRLIMMPSMITAWIFGLILVATPGVVDWSAAWSWVKAACVLAMTAFHFLCAAEMRALAAGRGRKGRTYRWMNEAPTVLMILIVLAVIVRF